MGIAEKLDRKGGLLGNASLEVDLSRGEGCRLGVDGKLLSDPHLVPARPCGAAQPQIASLQACVWPRPTSLPELLLVAMLPAGW